MTTKQLKSDIQEISKRINYLHKVYLFGSQKDKSRLSKKRDIDLLCVWLIPIPISVSRKFKSYLVEKYPDYKFDVISITKNQLDEKVTLFHGKRDFVLYEELEGYKELL